MDTKWKKSKAVIGFLAFLLGVSLVLEGALYFGTVFASSNSRNYLYDSFKSDWRRTREFKGFVSARLERLITMGAGGYVYGDVSGYDGGDWGLWDTKARSVHNMMKEDKNILYSIENDGKVLYSNTDADLAKNLPEGYGFLLRFDGEKVRIWMDGEEENIYGGGYYHFNQQEDYSQWYVPGYQNFTVDEAGSKVKVTMAVINSPRTFIKGNYGKTGAEQMEQYNQLYYIKQGLEKYREEVIGHAVRLGVGVALVVVYLLLRRDKKRADQAVAKATGKVWFEVKFVLLLLLLYFNIPRLSVMYDVWDELVYAYSPTYGTSGMSSAAYYDPETDTWIPEDYYMHEEPIRQTASVGTAVAILSENGGWLLRETLLELTSHTGHLLTIFWSLYFLLVNDWRYNRRPWKHGVIGMLAAHELKYPLQKRLSRMNGFLGLALLLLWLEVLFFLVAQTLELYIPTWAIWNLFGLPWLLALGVYGWIALRQRRLWTDFGAVADQAAAIRAGALEREVALPEDADLYPLADDLNHIRQGLHQAVEERTHSERMKVELVTNVSHDLKTPLTSIISYTELLSQEPLEPPASEYVQIMAEKAQRLKAMVQDVFEVSKAASGQLPVKLERLDYARLLRQTLADMAQAIENSGLALRTSIPEEEVPITADSDRLYRVFQNLIGNALKYSLPGSRVYLALAVEGGQAVASVRNTSAAELKPGADYTARFVRGDESRTDGGSGLGLSIAQSFTRACGGSLAVTTEADLFTAVVAFPVTPRAE